jgi:uncharacterized protein with HEPN domain
MSSSTLGLSMQPADLVRLLHMVEAAEEALGYAAGHQRSDLDRDRMRSRAIVRCIEIVGEAAAQLSQAARDAVPEVPWPAVVAMRNRLIHAYFDVDLDRVWDTVLVDLPALVSALRPHLELGDR